MNTYIPDAEEVQCLCVELKELLQKFLASNDILACGSLQFEQVQSSATRSSKKNRKLLTKLAGVQQHWMQHQKLYQHYILDRFKILWDEEYPSRRYVTSGLDIRKLRLYIYVV